MKKLLATFAILALCCVNAMAANNLPPQTDTAKVVVTIEKCVSVNIMEQSVDLKVNTIEGTDIVGTAEINVQCFSNCAASVNLSAAADSKLTFPVNGTYPISGTAIGTDVEYKATVKYTTPKGTAPAAAAEETITATITA